MPLGINTCWIFIYLFLNFILYLFFLCFYFSMEKLVEMSKYSRRTSGWSESGKLENIEIEHFRSDIKHKKLAYMLFGKPAHLWELVTRGFWVHTAPLCSQVKQHFFFFTVYRLSITFPLWAERKCRSPTVTHMNNTNTFALAVHSRVFVLLFFVPFQSLIIIQVAEWDDS